jgi:mannose-1-phosphate guanylyltransferase
MPQVFGVIMAGGVGSRFWPKSRERTPKQLLEIFGSGTMIQNTVARIQPLVSHVNTFVVTNALQYDAVVNQLPFIPKENILTEPVGRNTAPCIGLAASWIERIDPDGIMVVLPADHVIRDEKEFVRILDLSVQIAEKSDGLLTIGIKPSRPETGYGYIQFSDDDANNPYRQQGVYRVKTFAEKPIQETAERFLASGDFLWNSGMFVWKVRTILKEIEVHLPDLSSELRSLKPAMGTNKYEGALEHSYGVLRGISIDYGVMEKAGNVFVVKGDFGWNDVGSWDEVVRMTDADESGNTARGKVILRDSKNNYVDAGSKIVATIGVDDVIVVVTDDAVLVCGKGKSQEVKEIVDYIRRKQMNEYL